MNNSNYKKKMSSEANDFCINCPTDCAGDPPVLTCNPCVDDIENGQVENIYFTNIGNPLADAADFAVRLSNSATADPDAIRALCVKGTKDAPEADLKEIECDAIVVLNRTNTLTLDFKKLSDENYDAIRQIQCSEQWLFWFTYRGQSYLYGGLQGIRGNFIAHTESEGDGKSDALSGKLSVIWDSKCEPERITHPSPGLGCN